MMHIVTIGSCGQSRIFFDHLASVARSSDLRVSRINTTTPYQIRQDCDRKQLALVALTGTTSEVRTGFDVLRDAITMCPVGIVFDHAGYLECIEHHRDFPYRHIRFGVKVGKGAFDVSKVNCLVEQRKGAIIPLRETEWEYSTSLSEIVMKMRSVAFSASRMVSA